ncbi:hypothetical protein [Bosea sp. RAC05]|jgi:hypothetical protein|uniref:hypothetical protein n=1 Tax=Bosea sp. RAC05 TaxID=1842539 RepID=UPI00083E3C21|nr:hypothetical protein [Bosea sp. RAC05]AOG06649.1 hypothetical protein BSY19_623 [Bosea sp. RAC05]
MSDTAEPTDPHHDYLAAVRRLSEMAAAPPGTVDQLEFDMLLAVVEAWRQQHADEAEGTLMPGASDG